MAEKEVIIREKSKAIFTYSRNPKSIVSGTENPASIGCTLYALESGEAATVFTFNQWHSGHKIYGHGGLSAAVLDEVMGYANHSFDIANYQEHVSVFTGEATYRYLLPIPLGEPMYAYARVIKEEGRKRFITGEIIDGQGNLMVRSKSIYITTESLGDAKVEVLCYPPTEKDYKEL